MSLYVHVADTTHIILVAGTRNLKERLGISVDFENNGTHGTAQASRLHAYGTANVYYDFQSRFADSLSGARLVSEQDPLWGGIGIGGTFNWGDGKYVLYDEATLNTSLSNFRGSYSLTGRIG
ncbi:MULTISPECIES: hypothetical protein [unclassified Rhizobium]|uniref:hypothetical protein n=1 Tax=unclassified Rhizobium TaxID=2613769 RepID=UPI001ADCCFEB|nr:MULTISPECIES: hypothetical protein [unclassified Rhizobium]MBO9127858.1 hypothetical protein [Rhizobium sp. 16-488-2b]MBO9175146.1 hypothetical protein [Rhizobium sp. 16-488-2a]